MLNSQGNTLYVIGGETYDEKQMSHKNRRSIYLHVFEKQTYMANNNK